jgi:hypothetical protein
VLRTEVETATAIGIYPHLLALVSQPVAVGIHIQSAKVGEGVTHVAALVVEERIGIVAIYL